MPPVPKPPTAKNGRNRSLGIAIAAAGLVAVALIAGSILFTRDSGEDAVVTTGSTPKDTTPTGTTDAGETLVAGIPQKGTILGSPEATALKVPGTPWFYIGVGLNQPYEIQLQSLTPSAFRPALDDALKG